MELSEKHPIEALPCPSSPQANVLIFVAWDEEEKGVNVKHARSVSRELIAMIDGAADRELKEYENKGYGNYDNLKLCEKQRILRA
ncbi:hypothetical protein Clacol_002049 [Clathrus columnatus]|uniref:Uncharacterized protein n=1 Tax=Clathrus columnatus TaxID=1419009 RepID=A0AAV4ZZQ6_9AGAM|nr:hypothetical protein Clacol_002049 [Clathrus columnatus]